MDLFKQVLVAMGTANLLVHVCIAAKHSSSDGYSGAQSKKLPVILMHKQALSHDGTFNLQFAGDNGIEQGETIRPDGTRTGAYSYIDPNGETISVKYSAGKEGFQILEGSHIPRAPTVAAASHDSPQYGSASASGKKYASPFGDFRPLTSSQPSPASDEQLDDFGFGPTGSYSHYRGKVNTNFRPMVYRVQEENSGESYQASPTYARPRHREAAVDDADDEEDPNKPHSFGHGYSFEFGAAGKES